MNDGQLQLPVGDRTVRLVTPPDVANDLEEDGRIYFWWGLTAAALALSRELVSGGDLADRRVVELGCGLGLPGVVAGLGGARVTFTDAKADALVYARLNAEANGLPRERTSFEVLDWVHPETPDRFDYVLGTEILYDYNMHRAQLDLFDRLLAPGGTLLLADRRRRVVERFFGRLRDRGFGGTTTDHELALPGEPAHRITVFAWRRE
jgi:predicted nicotinamide N-methyase